MLTTSDLTVGALATVDADGVLEDRIATVSGDGVVTADGGFLWQLNRSSGDTVRRYTPGSLCRPDWEVALESGTNAHDALVVDDEVWVASYDRNVIERLDLETGEVRTPIELGPLVSADELVGGDGLLWVGGEVVLAGQRFDRTVVPWGARPGVIARFAADGTLVGQVEVGPSPRVTAHPMKPDHVLVATGIYGEPDGALLDLNPATGEVTELLTEADLGQDLETQGLVALGSVVVVPAADFDLFPAGGGTADVSAVAALHCLNLESGELQSGPAEPGWFIDAAAVGQQVWVGLRRGWGPAATPGLLALDPSTCSEVGPRLGPALEPYSLTAVSGLPDES